MIKKILLVNQGGTDNIGDQLINSTMVSILEKEYIVESMNLEIDLNRTTLAEKIKEEKNKKFNLIGKAVYIPKVICRIIFGDYIYFYNHTLTKLKKTRLEEYDLVLIGGGELFKSKHLFLPSIDAWTKYIKDNTNSKIILYGISSDDWFTQGELYRINKFIKRFDYINARDRRTERIFNKFFGTQLAVSPDCVFLHSFYHNIKYEKENTILVNIFDYKSWNFNTQFKNRKEYFTYWFNLINKEAKGNLNSVRFTYTTIEDAYCALDFYKCFKGFFPYPPQIGDEYGLDEIIADIASAMAIITARMHAMILAKQFNTKIVPFIFKSKIKSFVQDFVDSDVDMDTIQKDAYQGFVNAGLVHMENKITK